MYLLENPERGKEKEKAWRRWEEVEILRHVSLFFLIFFLKSVNCLFIIEVWVGFISLSKFMIVID